MNARSAGRVAVIGAGAAGLVCARELARVGLEPVVFEAADALGGTWIYCEGVESDPLGRDPERRRVHTSMYAGLRTNLPRDLMAFRDFPFDSRGGGDDHWARFPGHAEVLTYLRRFARHFGLEERVRLNTRVTAVRPCRVDAAPWVSDAGGEPARWQVEALEAGQTTEALFDAVAVCSGHYSEPRVPEIPGAERFPGRLMHSHNYRRPDAFEKLRVVMLGARASGIDLSLEVGQYASAVHLCARDFSEDRLFPGRANVWLRPAIARLEESGAVVLEDGSRIEGVDVLLFCTGYRYVYPFLGDAAARALVSAEDNWVDPLYRDLLSVRAPTLAFLGLPYLIVPFPFFEFQARYFAAVASGEVSIPPLAERLDASRRQAELLRAAGVARRHFFQYGGRQFPYVAELAGACGVEGLPETFERVYSEVERARLRDPGGYRDAGLSWFDAESERLARGAAPPGAQQDVLAPAR